ncbi:MAG TPA: hypothetical protein VF613_12870 [Longimicrobium sp.]|jgi:hypothetical protein
MRFVRPLLALAALCTAAACADTSRITAPEAPSRAESGGGLMGSGTVTSTSAGGGWIGSGNAAPAPSDTTNRSGGWIGSGN